MEKFILTQSISLNSILSLYHADHYIEVSGFECMDYSVHMIEWLKKGSNFREFIVNDIETGLNEQDQGSLLISIKCINDPDYKTKVHLKSEDDKLGTLSEFDATFFLSLVVKSGDGVTWNLEVNQNYNANHLETPDKSTLTLNFIIVNAKQ